MICQLNNRRDTFLSSFLSTAKLHRTSIISYSNAFAPSHLFIANLKPYYHANVCKSLKQLTHFNFYQWFVKSDHATRENHRYIESVYRWNHVNATKGFWRIQFSRFCCLFVCLNSFVYERDGFFSSTLRAVAPTSSAVKCIFLQIFSFFCKCNFNENLFSVFRITKLEKENMDIAWFISQSKEFCD